MTLVHDAAAGPAIASNTFVTLTTPGRNPDPDGHHVILEPIATQVYAIWRDLPDELYPTAEHRGP